MKLCFISTSRADYGTLKSLIDQFIYRKKIKTHLILTGSHSEKIYGSSSEIEKGGKIKIHKINVKSKNYNDKYVAKSFSEISTKITDEFKKISPDAVVIFGDRYEMLAATISAYILKINIIHIAGGEKTSGSLDEGFRHCITKLANLHFPVAAEYKKRLLQMGENPKTVFNYGSLNYDKIKNNKFLGKKNLEKDLKIKFKRKNLVLTYNPDTLDIENTIKNLEILLLSISKLKDTLIIITSPNADSKGVLMIKFIKKFIQRKKLSNIVFFKSLGSRKYLSILKFVDGVIGNSSSGISEVPFFGIGTINLGDRQNGRILVPSIINCDISQNKIKKAIKLLYSKKFRSNIQKNMKHYGTGKSVKKIANKIISFNFKKFKKKEFRDL